MSKVNITIGRSLTVNTGNFQSVRPNVEITLNDIDSKDVESLGNTLSNLVESLLKIETVKAVGMIKQIETEGHMGYCKSILESIDDIEKLIEDDIGVINL